MSLSALLGHYDIPTKRPTNRQTDRPGHREVWPTKIKCRIFLKIVFFYIFGILPPSPLKIDYYARGDWRKTFFETPILATKGISFKNGCYAFNFTVFIIEGQSNIFFFSGPLNILCKWLTIIGLIDKLRFKT